MELKSPTEFAKEKVQAVQEYTLLAVQSVSNLFRKPLYFADMVQQADLIGVGSLPIVVLTGFFTGGVLALQTANTLQRFGSITLIGQLVSTSMVRELGPVLTGLMVAGRNSSGMASELGSMVVTELFLSLDARQYWSNAWQVLVLQDVFMGLLKPVMFGFIIATVGCYYGMTARGGTQGVGRATTQAVVAASVFILVTDFFVTKLLISVMSFH